VRELIAGGAEVVVVAPRPSAAHLVAPLAGGQAARSLRRLRHRTGATDLVLCLEPGLAFSPQGSRRRHEREARRLIGALTGFDRVRLLTVGELGVDPAVLARVAAAADEVDEIVATVDGAVAADDVRVSLSGPPETSVSGRSGAKAILRALYRGTRRVLADLSRPLRRSLARWVARPPSRS
jgi:hypothetical protein